MSARHHETFGSIRAEVRAEVARRFAEPGEGGQAGESAARGGEATSGGETITGLLERLEQFFEAEDVGRYQDAVRRWVKVQLGEGESPEGLLHVVTVVGSAVMTTARDRFGYGPEADAFVREVARAGYWAARAAVSTLGDQLEAREAERRELSRGEVV